MTPERNLDIQAALVVRARACVGTQGGCSRLAPLRGSTGAGQALHG